MQNNLLPTKYAAAIMALVFVCLASQTGHAQQTLRPVFDESFAHWPVDLKTNGSIIVNRSMTDNKSSARTLRRIVEGKKITLFSSQSDALANQLKSLAGDDEPIEPECTTDELKSALAAADGVYLGADCFPAKDLLSLKNQFVEFTQRGGNLIVDASMGEVLGAKQVDGKPGLNVLPDCQLNCSFESAAASKQDLAKSLSASSRSVGIGIESNTMLVLAGRRLISLGSGSTTLALPANESQPATFQKLTGKRSRQQESIADLTQWRRRAIDRSLPPFPPKKPMTPFVENGSLYIVGGGGTPRGLMAQMIKEAGGIKNAKCVFIPCSESDDVGEQQRIVSTWKRMGVKHATFIHTKDRNQANTDDEFLEPLKDATLLWFGGGRQWNFADSYYGTEAHKLMKDVLHRGGVIGGSSAGASIQARFLARATPIGNSNILAPGYERGGLGFLSGVAIDQHFSQRRRQADMTKLVAKYPQLLGIGIDESTAIIVRKSQAEVVGKGKVFFYNRNEPVEKGKPDYTAVPAGGVYDLEKREVVEDADAE